MLSKVYYECKDIWINQYVYIMLLIFKASIRRRQENQGLSMSLSMAPQSEIQTPRTMSVTHGQVPIPQQLTKRNYIRQKSQNNTLNDNNNQSDKSRSQIEEKEELQIVEKDEIQNENINDMALMDQSKSEPTMITNIAQQQGIEKKRKKSKTDKIAKLENKSKSVHVSKTTETLDKDKKKKKSKHKRNRTVTASSSAFIQRPQAQNSLFNVGGFVSRSVLDDSSSRTLLRTSRSNKPNKTDKDTTNKNDDDNDRDSFSFSD